MKKTQKRIVALLLAGSIALSPASGGEKAADASGRTKKDPETGLTYLLEQGSTRKKGDAAWQTRHSKETPQSPALRFNQESPASATKPSKAAKTSKKSYCPPP